MEARPLFTIIAEAISGLVRGRYEIRRVAHTWRIISPRLDRSSGGLTILGAMAGDALDRRRTSRAAVAAAGRRGPALSARMLRVARTMTDLSGVEQVGRIHVAEALSSRPQPPRA